jgi:phosphoribosylglycinamide formyltransferase-1
MYGQAVHEAVIAAKEKESGITIHYADELYDHGKIIFQPNVPCWRMTQPDLWHSGSILWNMSIMPGLIEEVLKSEV